MENTAAATGIDYTETVEIEGIRVPLAHGIVTPAIEKPLRAGRYEAGECRLLKDRVRPDDRILDLGAGLGLVSAVAARRAPLGRVMAVEANPKLHPVIRETWALNGIENAELLAGVATLDRDDGTDFYLRHDFWASSTEADSRPFISRVSVPGIPLAPLIARFRPTILSCDIEGAELGLLDALDLSSVREIVLETHPKVYGPEGRSRLLAALARQGFRQVPQPRPSTVFVLTRADAPAPLAEAPRIVVPTCMKDEGPYILEWLAWHKAIGVTDFVVFSNDCSDGSDALLDRLDEMGEITHLPNPASTLDVRAFQPVALKYAQDMPVFRKADMAISMDVDEFINVRVGKHRLPDVFAAVPDFDALSINELNHGANGVRHFADGWVTEQFPGHITETPRDRRARTGVKTITRRTSRLQSLRNHRPMIAGTDVLPLWLDGSGEPLDDFNDPGINGCDCRGRFDLVSLDHFALRSLDAFLIKWMRGDVVSARRNVDEKYWKVRNRNEAQTSDLGPGRLLAREVYTRFEDDTELMRLHRQTVEAHKAKAREIDAIPEAADLRQWIEANAWADRVPAAVE